jgi:metal-sulfur cluster biosynthetic enzyme
MTSIAKDDIVKALKTVEDPEIHIDVYTLGLIYNIDINDAGIDILMTLTTPFCPYGNQIVQSVEKALKPFGVEVRVEITFEPEWEPPEDVRIALGI